MKRWLIKLAWFVILGAIVNVAVAWGCAWFVVPTRTMNGTAAQFKSGDDIVQGWTVHLWEEFGTTRITGGHGRGRQSDSPPTADVLPAWSEFESIATRVGASAIGKTHPASGSVAERRVIPSGIVDDGRGWPLRSMRCWWNYGLSNDALSRKETLHTGILLAPYPGARGGPLHEQRALPLQPIWPGFAINTVFYAVVLWLLFAAPFALRRRRRIRRGLCPKCAYDLRGTPVGATACPECGAAVNRMPE